jgi:hypothetical protein
MGEIENKRGIVRSKIETAREQMLQRMMDLQRDKADRDHLIRELAKQLERMVEVAPSGTDVKPALRLYNRAQDLVGWKDDE